MRLAESKIRDWQGMAAERRQLRKAGLMLVFTNGCFDILHAGHVDYLQFARQQGDRLVIGLNSDCSVSRNKGPSRPIVPEKERGRVLAALECVDYVVLFDQDEPAELVAQIVPDILVKGADWAHYVSGREVVEKNGGRIVLADLTADCSTTDIIAKIREEK